MPLKTTNRIPRPRDFSKINGQFNNYSGDLEDPQFVQTDNPDIPDANNYRSLTYTITPAGEAPGTTLTQDITLGRRFKITNMRFNGARNPAANDTYSVSFDGEVVGTGVTRSPTVGGIGTLTDVTGIFADQILSETAIITISLTLVAVGVGYLEYRIQGFFMD